MAQSRCCERYTLCEEIQASHERLSRLHLGISETDGDATTSGTLETPPINVMGETRHFLESILAARRQTPEFGCKLRLNSTLDFWITVVKSQTGLILWIDLDRDHISFVRGFRNSGDKVASV
jgi:hypothetical protein